MCGRAGCTQARHFLPLNALRRQIDGMSFSKMNAFHWHLTDAQSTPLKSVVYPKLELGAFHPTAVYTLEDIQGIVEYARVRSVQVLLEIDMPGHSFAFGVGYPELIVNCTAMYPLETEFWTSSLDISRGEALYTWLEGLLTELTAILPNSLFHIGGDEVQYQCWQSSPTIVAYLKQRNITAVQLYVTPLLTLCKSRFSSWCLCVCFALCPLHSHAMSLCRRDFILQAVSTDRQACVNVPRGRMYGHVMSLSDVSMVQHTLTTRLLVSSDAPSAGTKSLSTV
jgi:hypothetical protein